MKAWWKMKMECTLSLFLSNSKLKSWTKMKMMKEMMEKETLNNFNITIFISRLTKRRKYKMRLKKSWKLILIKERRKEKNAKSSIFADWSQRTLLGFSFHLALSSQLLEDAFFQFSEYFGRKSCLRCSQITSLTNLPKWIKSMSMLSSWYA